jgi:hypothetical protein
MHRAGHRPFYWPAPDGYPEDQQHWLGSNGLLYVLRCMDWLCDRSYSTEDRVMPILPITQAASLDDLPSNSPNDLATFWLSRILGYAPEGGWPGSSLHTNMRDFLVQNPNDPSLWPADIPFTDIDGTYSPWYFYERLRALVKLILSSSEFLHR